MKPYIKYMYSLATIASLNVSVYVVSGCFLQSCYNSSNLYFTNNETVRWGRTVIKDPVRSQLGNLGCVLVYVICPLAVYPICPLVCQLICLKHWKKIKGLRVACLFYFILMFIIIHVYSLGVNPCWYTTPATPIFACSTLLHVVLFTLFQCHAHRCPIYRRQQGDYTGTEQTLYKYQPTGLFGNDTPYARSVDEYDNTGAEVSYALEPAKMAVVVSTAPPSSIPT